MVELNSNEALVKRRAIGIVLSSYRWEYQSCLCCNFAVGTADYTVAKFIDSAEFCLVFRFTARVVFTFRRIAVNTGRHIYRLVYNV